MGSETADYVRSRAERYEDGHAMHAPWAQEVLDDPDVAALEPDPKSRIGASWFIGHSPGAGRIVTVIAYRDLDGELHLINMWPATGHDPRLYGKGSEHGQDH